MLALAWDSPTAHADLSYQAGSLRHGDELATAVILSLFLNAPAKPGDVVPEGADRAGWWADAFDEDHPGDVQGSRLWLLERMKVSDEKVRLAREYAEEALAWMVEDQVAAEVIVEAIRHADDSIWMSVDIRRPDEPAPRNVGYWEALRGV